jgi:hypothetical protein
MILCAGAYDRLGLCSVSPIAASSMASAGSLMTWKVSPLLVALVLFSVAMEMRGCGVNLKDVRGIDDEKELKMRFFSERICMKQEEKIKEIREARNINRKIFT